MGTILIVGMAPKMRFSHLSAKRDSSARSTLTGGRLLSRPRRLWRWRTACSRGRSHRSLTQNAPRFSTVLHLSRACLGKLIGFNLMGMAQKRRSFVFRTEILCKVGVDRLRDVHGLGCPLRKGAALGDGGGEQALLEGSAHHVLHGDTGRTCSRTTQVAEIKRRDRAKKPRQRKEGTV